MTPELSKPLLSYGLSADVLTKILELTARLQPFCSPEEISDMPMVNYMLQQAGLINGYYSSQNGVDLPSAVATAIAEIASVRHAKSSTYLLDLGNQWSRLQDKYSDDSKGRYLVRAFLAAQGYLQLKSDQAQYPFYNVLK